ncbi:ABC transporter substrate-binding protein [Thermodesulfobacteriota bacterium]
MMKLNKYFLVVALAATLVFTGIALSAPKRPTTVAELALYEGADRQQILEEGARKEGKIVYYTVNVNSRLHANPFQKKYPYIKVEIWRASSNKLIPRLHEEYRGGSYTCDIVEIPRQGMMVLQKAGLLQPFYSPELVNINEDTYTKAPGGGVFQSGIYESYIGMGYNSNLITKEELPKTYPDLLDPKWRGKVALSGGFGTTSWIAVMLLNYGEDFVRRMAKQNFDVHMVSSRALFDMIIAGEYILSPSMYNSHGFKSKKEGAPVDWAPLEPAPVMLSQVAIPKHSSHPHAALLMLDFNLSKEDAQIYKETGYMSPRKDFTAAETFKKFYGANSAEEWTKWENLVGKLILKR